MDEWTTYVSFGLKMSDAVEEHAQAAGEKAAFTWGSRHGEGLPTSSDTVGKQQA